ncbi:MAG: hypothetical protein ACI93R_003462 [Flavobacteriales bacterium]|jgi:hypothetical protein
MNEQQRMQYMESMGIDMFVPRLRLVNAAESPQCELPVAVEPIAALGAAEAVNHAQSSTGSATVRSASDVLSVLSDITEELKSKPAVRSYGAKTAATSIEPSGKLNTDPLESSKASALYAEPGAVDSPTASIDNDDLRAVSRGTTGSVQASSALGPNVQEANVQELNTQGANAHGPNVHGSNAHGHRLPAESSANALTEAALTDAQAEPGGAQPPTKAEFTLGLWLLDSGVQVIDSRSPRDALPTDALLSNVLQACGLLTQRMPSIEIITWPFANSSVIDSSWQAAQEMMSDFLGARFFNEKPKVFILWGEEAAKAMMGEAFDFPSHCYSCVDLPGFDRQALMLPSLKSFLLAPAEKRHLWSAFSPVRKLTQ